MGGGAWLMSGPRSTISWAMSSICIAPPNTLRFGQVRPVVLDVDFLTLAPHLKLDPSPPRHRSRTRRLRRGRIAPSGSGRLGMDIEDRIEACSPDQGIPQIEMLMRSSLIR